MLSPSTQSLLRSLLAEGAVIITANRRLQRALAANASPNLSQPAPAIYAADDWIHQHWLELQDQGFPGAERTLISPFQSCKLWQEIVEQDPPPQALISPSQLARKAESAAQLVAEWDISLQEPGFEGREEYRYFRQWLNRFHTLAEQRNLASTHYCRAWVQRAFEIGALPSVGKILLYGFDDLSPRLNAIFTAAAEQLDHWRPQLSSRTQAVRCQAPDTEAEIRAAALWSRQRFENNPNARIGIVVPRLTALRATVERIFAEVYETGAWFPAQARRTPPFNFSAGVPLASTPLVADALSLLSLNQTYLSPDDWRRLLLSPFWGEGLDHCRHALLLQLNRSSKTRFSVAELRRAAAKLQDEQSWQLSEAMGALAECLRRQPRRQSYSAWADFFAQQLGSCQWPGGRVLDSPEYQQQQHLYQLLDQLSQCDASLSTPVDLAEALQLVRELAENTTFQAQTQPSPVQILGLLEAAGLHFDHCWVMDLADTSWPPAAQPNPFIPLDTQVQLGLPRSSAERELAYARALTLRLQEASDEAVFSWPASEGDLQFQPSQLIQSLKLKPLEELAPPHTPLQCYMDAVAQSAVFEWVDCSRGPAWHDLSLPLPGGTGAIGLQAVCPFNAFAVYRLGAFRQEQATPGLNGAERGTLIHEIMASVWQSLKDQAALLALPPESLEALVQEKIDTVLSTWQSKRGDVLHPRFYRLEQRRLSALVQTWLKLEMQRPFFAVTAIETPQTLEFPTSKGIARMSGRLDRVDTLASGKKLILDYKTGSASVNQWQGERPADLQLPLYAIAQEEDVTAIAFAEVHAKRTTFTGLGVLPPEDERIDGIVPPNAPRMSQLPADWGETLDYWRRASAELLQEFIEGHCEVAIYNKGRAQYFAYLEPLNRILEL